MPNYFYIQNDGVFVPTNQLAGSYAALNIVEKNSLGIGTTTLEPRPNPDNPNWIADVNSSDLWGYTVGGDIYRMTKVGIKNDNPTDDCDITGTLRATDTVRFTKDEDTTSAVTGTLRVTGGVGVSCPCRQALSGKRSLLIAWQYSANARAPVPHFHARVQVSLRPSVLDPAGEATRAAAGRLGVAGVTRLRIGKAIEVEIEAPDQATAQQQLELLSERLLANPVIENWTLDLIEIA